MFKKLFPLIILIFFVACEKEPSYDETLVDQSVIEITSKANINDLIVNALEEGRYFKWSELSVDDLWTAIELSENKVNVFWSMDASANKSTNRIEQIILKGEQLSSKAPSPIFEKSTTLNYLASEIYEKQTLIELLNSGEVEYVEPLYEMITEEEYEAMPALAYPSVNYDAGLLTNSKTVFNAPADEAYFNNGIDVAWQQGLDGKDITVAVIDNGPQNTHPLFGKGVNSNTVTNLVTGATYNKSIEKEGFYKQLPFFFIPFDGVFQQGFSITPQHGTQMLNLIGGAPNDIHFSQGNEEIWGTGVAYGSDLISIRSSRSVFIGFLSSRIGVRKAFESLAQKDDVQVISMSQGLLWWDEGIARAIRKNEDKGRLIFCAGGTAPEFIVDLVVGFKDFFNDGADRGSVTLFPAKMDEEVQSVTGVVRKNGELDWCADCHGKADFVLEFNEGEGSSSTATAATAGIAALIWGTDHSQSADDVLRKMKEFSEYPVNKDPRFGHGTIDVGAFANSLSAD